MYTHDLDKLIGYAESEKLKKNVPKTCYHILQANLKGKSISEFVEPLETTEL